MANQIIIDIGAAANDGTGDPLRTAFNYVNENFTTIWNTGVATSNVIFSGNRILTLNTNGNLVLAPNGIGKVVANVDIVPNSNVTHSLGAQNRRWNTVYTRDIDIGGNLVIAGDVDFGGDLTVDGNLTVNGTTTTINTANVDIEDKVITIAFGSPNAAVANGSGITVAGANANIIWTTSNGWTMNNNLAITGNVTANYFIGDGSQLTGIAPSRIFNGASQVTIPQANGAVFVDQGTQGVVRFAFQDTGNVFTNTGEIVSQQASLLLASDLQSYESTLKLNSDTATLPGVELRTRTGTIELSTNTLYGSKTWEFGGLGDLTAPGNITTVGNISANYFIGDGSLLTGTYGNANVVAYLPTYTGNLSSGNLTVSSGTNTWTIADQFLTGPGGAYWHSHPEQSTDDFVSAPGSDIRIQSINANSIIESQVNLTDTDIEFFVNNGVSRNWRFNESGATELPGDITPVLSIGASADIGNVTNPWTNAYVSGNVNAGNVNLTGTVSSNLIPTGNNTQSLGNATNQWSDLWVSNATIYMNSVPITLGAGNVLTVDGQAVLSNDSNISISTTGNITAAEFFGNIAAGNVIGLATVATSGSYTDLANTPTIPTATSNLTNDSGYITTATANVVSVNGQSGVVTLVIPTATSNLTNDSGFITSANIPTNVSAFNNDAGYITTATANVISVNGQSGVVTLSIPTTTSNLTNDSGFITTGNLESLTSNIVTTANISGAYILGNGSQLTGLPASYTDSNVTTLLSSLGSNVISGTGNITTTANISGQYILGNAAFMTGIPASYGDTNVATFLAAYGSNSISTTGNITAGNISGNISITGNVTGTSSNVTLVAGSYSWTFNNAGNLVLPGNTFALNYANGTAVTLGGGTYGDSNVTTLLASLGSNTISGAGNITTTANISGQYILGNAAFMTGIPASYGNANVADFLDSLGSNAIVTTGNITGGNLITSGLANIAGNAVIGNITTTNITGTSANVTITANAFVTTFDTTGLVSFPGNVDIAGNAQVTGTASNLIRRASVSGVANTAVTLDNFQARLGGSPTRLYINTVTGNTTLTGTSQTCFSGSQATVQWVNVPVGAGAANAFAMSGAVSPSSGGEMVVLNFADQNSGTFMYRVTAIVSNTSSGTNMVSIERLA